MNSVRLRDNAKHRLRAEVVALISISIGFIACGNDSSHDLGIPAPMGTLQCTLVPPGRQPDGHVTVGCTVTCQDSASNQWEAICVTGRCLCRYNAKDYFSCDLTIEQDQADCKQGTCCSGAWP